MKKRFLALGLAITLALSGSMTVSAAQVQEPESDVVTMVEQEDGSFAVESESNVAAVLYGADTENLPPIEAPAWIKWDHSNRVGGTQFAEVEAAEGSYHFQLLKDGEVVASRRYSTLFNDTINWAHDINESGTYVTEVAALGDGETTGNSTYTRSDEFVYTKPATVLGTPQNLRWNAENPTLAEWDAVENAGGYEVCLYVDGKLRYSASSYSTSFTSNDWAHRVTKSGEYTFTVRALADNINEIANGVESEHSSPYNATGAIAQVKNTLDDALTQAQTDANAALETVKGLNKSDLQAAMQADEEARDKIRQLEDAYAKQNNINVSNNVDASISDKMDTSKINVVGTALNATAANTNMTLNFRKPEKEAVIDASQYKNAVQIDITLDGVTDSQNLTVPMTLTVPIPDGVSTNRFHLIHCHVDGTKETIHPIINEADRTATFTITRFSTFVFANENDGSIFSDVSTDAWYYNAVNFVYTNNIMSGTGNGMFSPDMSTDRAMVVQILYNLSGKPAVTGDKQFTDVAPDAWYAKAVQWAAETGISAGVSATEFAPERSVTRQEVAALLYRYAQMKGYDVSGRNDLTSFSDSDAVASWALTSMQWANNSKIINGKGNGQLAPEGTASRAEIASMMKGFMEKYN